MVQTSSKIFIIIILLMVITGLSLSAGCSSSKKSVPIPSPTNNTSIIIPTSLQPTVITTPSPKPKPTSISTIPHPSYAGVRASNYGITPFPTFEEWDTSITTMSDYWNATPTTIWLVGEIEQMSGECVLQFQNPTIHNYSYISFKDVGIDHDQYFEYFDKTGTQVLLSLEPGNADVSTLIDLVLTKYMHHTSIIGIGVDIEWYKYPEYPIGAAVTDAEAREWENKIKIYNQRYRLFLKHWSNEKMPPSYRGDIIFIDDSQGFQSLSDMVGEFGYWADAFPLNAVFFQVGYETDEIWWRNLSNPPKDMGNAIGTAILPNQEFGIFWVDFTIDRVLMR